MGFLGLIPLLFAAPAHSAGFQPVAVQVQYLKTGREDDTAAARLGVAEVENANPCVGKMRRDLLELTKRPDLTDAAALVSQTFPSTDRIIPYLVLRYMNEAIELRFELRGPGPLDANKHEGPEIVRYRKGVYVTEKPGSWQERIDGDVCHVSEGKFTALVDELREADRLAACVMRKREILEGSQKVTNYVHNYLPVNWLEEAKERLANAGAPVGSLLRDDPNIYRAGNATFHECQRGLRLLEEDASSSVRVLNEVRDTKKGIDVPNQEIEDLERLLMGVAK